MTTELVVSNLKPAARQVHRPNVVRARYEAAQTTDDNRRHFAFADALSADAAANPAIRYTLRNRSRAEFANDCHLNGIVQTYANDIVGTGPTIQFLSDDEGYNTFLERDVAQYLALVRWAEKLRTKLMTRVVSGECFNVAFINPALPARTKLDFRLIEPEQVANQTVNANPNYYDGITYDQWGNPTQYDVLRGHPCDIAGAANRLMDADPWPADLVYHFYKPLRPGQRRGVPDVTPALLLIPQLRRFRSATIAAAETAADFAAVATTDQPPADGESTPGAMDVIELEKRMMTVLPGGYQLGQIKAEHPTTTYGDFTERILSEIARCLNMPYNVAAANSSKYNYSSGRLDYQGWHRTITIERAGLEDCTRWAVNKYLLLSGVKEIPPMKCFWPGMPQVDELKAANAQEVRLLNGTTTLSAEYAAEGIDWRVATRQRLTEEKFEIEERARLGLPPRAAPDSRQPKPSNTNAEDN